MRSLLAAFLLLLGARGVPAPDPSFKPIETLNLDQALWGAELPNTLKGTSVAWDGSGGTGKRSGLLYAAGIATGRLLVIDPAVGYPIDSIDLDVGPHGPSMMRVDEARRTLYWISRIDGSVRVIDLNSRACIAKLDGQRSDLRGPGGHRPSVVRQAAIDPATGWLWVANLRSGVTGYSRDLRSTKEVPGLSGPVSVAAHPKGDELVIVDAPRGQGGRVLRYVPSTGTSRDLSPSGGGKPVDLHFAPDGTRVLVGKFIAALGADEEPRWRTPLPSVPSDIAFASGAVAVVLEELGHEEGRAESVVVLYDLATGAERGRVDVRYEAKWAAADDAGGRIFVGNGGDGSVSVIDARTAKLTGIWDAGNAAEQVVIDPKTGTRFVLNRLGGSLVYTWAAGASKVGAWPAGKWPSELALDGTRRRLYALGHYDAQIYAWDLDLMLPRPALDLGVPRNASDTLGDMDHDEAVGLAAVVFPETGSLLVADVEAGKILWSRTEESLRVGPKGGPGNATVSVDGARGKVYVVSGKGSTVTAYDLRTGSPGASITIDATQEYMIDFTWLDRAGGRLFVGPVVVSVPALKTVRTLESVAKVFWSDASQILGLRPGSRGAPDELVQLDPKTYAERKARPLVATEMMQLHPAYDPARRRVYATDMAQARVF